VRHVAAVDVLPRRRRLMLRAIPGRRRS